MLGVVSQQCCVRLHGALSLTAILARASGPNNVGRAVQTDPTLLRYASAITEQKKCWELLAEKFDRFQTLRNNTQQHPTTCNRVCKRTQHVTSNNVGSCWPTMLRPFARGFKIWNEIPTNPKCLPENSFKKSICFFVWSAYIRLEKSKQFN